MTEARNRLHKIWSTLSPAEKIIFGIGEELEKLLLELNWFRENTILPSDTSQIQPHSDGHYREQLKQRLPIIIRTTKHLNEILDFLQGQTTARYYGIDEDTLAIVQNAMANYSESSDYYETLLTYLRNWLESQNIQRSYLQQIDLLITQLYRINTLLPIVDYKVETAKKLFPHSGMETYDFASPLEDPRIHIIEEPGNAGEGPLEISDTISLKLPSQPTSIQSSTYLVITVDDKPVKIFLSHTEAAFIHYLGEERNAGGSYWLEKPNEHKDILESIFNRFSLKTSLEEQINWDSIPTPPPSRLAWFWDFKNISRRGICNQIHRKIKFQFPESDLTLIQALDPKTPARIGNYSLISSIHRFTVFK
jgi:hypothetical protein